MGSDIIIGDDVAIAMGVTLTTHTHQISSGKRRAERKTVFRPIVIGDGCWIGANVTILPGVTIGRSRNGMHYGKVQMTQMEILRLFMDICERHRLRWYMIGGSLIGVLRHKGFIPWDDDIDIGMPRKDYDKFVSLQAEYPDGYGLTCHGNTPEWQFNFSQFIDKEAEIEVLMNELPRKCHVWLDIFPIDGLPANGLRRWFHVKHILMYRYLVQIPNIRTQVDTHKVGRPWHEKLVIRLLHVIPVSKLVSVDKCLSAMQRVLRKHDFDKSRYAGNMLGKYREREVVMQKWWGEPRKMPFENITVNVPSNADAINRHIYGDYMRWPVEKDRVSHDIKIIKLRGTE